jgi:hypothetical protein
VGTVVLSSEKFNLCFSPTCVVIMSKRTQAVMQHGAQSAGAPSSQRSTRSRDSVAKTEAPDSDSAEQQLAHLQSLVRQGAAAPVITDYLNSISAERRAAIVSALSGKTVLRPDVAAHAAAHNLDVKHDVDIADDVAGTWDCVQPNEDGTQALKPRAFKKSVLAKLPYAAEIEDMFIAFGKS